MAEAGALERGHVRQRLIRELATGEHTQAELGRRHGVSRQAVSAFAAKHAERIADVASRLDDEFAGLWIASKTARIAELEAQVDRLTELLTDPEVAARANVGVAEVERTIQSAIRNVSEELGQLPARVQVQHSGSLDVRLNGVDLDAL